MTFCTGFAIIIMRGYGIFAIYKGVEKMNTHVVNVIMMLAACGAFLVGFKFLSDNMEKLFGNSLKKLFNKTSDQKWVGVGMGAVSTAVVQSSGVTTVMVVGFVNAGIMSLYQAATVIMGANIGTTITAQLAAFSSFDIAPIFISLLFIGVMMEMLSKKDKVKSIGLALAGLGLVFFGLECMSASMSAYKSHPKVLDMLGSMSNPFLLLAFGIGFTALLQSSSAVTTIIIAMAANGLMIGGGGNAVLYIILGSNIGSCVTALISSIGTSVNARRASMIHLLFNITGTIIFTVMLLIWSDSVVHSNFYEVTFVKWFKEPTTQIAMFHTFFNVLCTLMFLPFTKLLVKVSTLLIRDKKAAEREPWELVYMDKRFLATPTVALEQLKKETMHMSDMAMESVATAFNGFIDRDIDVVEKINEYTENVAKIGEQISDYLVRVSACGISFADEKIVSAIHSNVGDVARVAELADNFTKYIRREVKENLVFSEGINEKLAEMHALLQEQHDMVRKIILEGDTSLLAPSDAKEDEIDTMRRELVAEHIARLGAWKCRPENNTIFINLVCNMERIGVHLTFIAHSMDN